MWHANAVVKTTYSTSFTTIVDAAMVASTTCVFAAIVLAEDASIGTALAGLLGPGMSAKHQRVVIRPITSIPISWSGTDIADP